MSLKGRLVHSPGGEKPIIIEQAAITAERIALEWNQDGQSGHLLAKSPNGSHFKGRYGYRNGKSDFECDLTLYKGAYEDLLYGTWRDPGDGAIGTLVIRLPSRSVETRAPARAVGSSGAELEPAALPSAPAIAKREPAAAPRENAGPLPISTARAAPGSISPGPAPLTAAPAPSKPLVAAPLDAAHFDYLLAITPEQFAQRKDAEIEDALLKAPLPALFKLSHNALATEVREIAARLFAERYGVLPASDVPAPPSRPAESPEARAQKRRSSRHKQRRS